MLIVRSTVAKVLPASMHSRWDTWTAAWLNEATVLPTLVTGFVPPFLGTSSSPVLQGALCCAGMFGINASVKAWTKRNRKEWTFPHHQWKSACAKIEAKLKGIVHMPHMYRTGALCDLSYVLKDAELDRLGRAAKLAQSLGIPSDKIVTTDWMQSYTTGNMSAMMLKPDVLGGLHMHLGFGQTDIDQWVEASYIQRIHSDLKDPLPGTVQALANLADANPATMGFYLQKHPAYTERKKIYDPSFVVKWDEDESSAWFQKTQWPKTVELMHQMQAQSSTPANPVPIPGAMDLYRQVMRGQEMQHAPAVDGALFDIDMSELAPR